MTEIKMHLTDHEITQWARCAQAMYARGASAQGHALSAAAATKVIDAARHDRCASIYRNWLVFDEPKQ